MSAPMTDGDRLEQIRARADAATPGPWWEWRYADEQLPDEIEPDAAHDLRIDSDERTVVYHSAQWSVERADSAFIAQAREDIPWLLARLAALTEERDAYEDAIKQIVVCEERGTIGYGVAIMALRKQRRARSPGTETER